MPKLIMLKGLPGCGKSTWAQKTIQNSQKNTFKRINKDLLRECFDFSKFSKGNEKIILSARDELIKLFAEEGKHIIIDDTNLHPKHEINLKKLADELNYQFIITDFTDVSLKDCIKNDLKRDRSVGERVIKDMYNKYVQNASEVVYEEDEGLPSAIICDIDGTVAKMNGRKPYDWHLVNEDNPNWPVINTVKALKKDGYKIIFFTGRDGNQDCETKTIDWLEEHFGWENQKDFELYIRMENDNRKDSIIKKEMFDNHIRGKYFIHFVIDDRDQVVDMWRNELGLTCLQVDYGDF